ncbi:MAG: cation:proton antiporter [candidate division KSB1 bacterium]|nr:cation:proton antiporter [candidate division KSB1 bacterium]MDZ7345581.1 cation:proton antiporter [candidate division KSB1 bacterium]
MHFLDEEHILLFLLQLLILMGFARGLGELFRKWKQPALTAEILVGVMLGPTLLGRFLPEFQQMLFPPDAIQQSMLEAVAWLGVLFLLLETGIEIDFSIAWRQRGSAFIIALVDIVVPMIVAFAAVIFLPDRYMVAPDHRILFSLFMAVVMTISAMPVAARVLHDLGLLKAEIGFLVMSALAVNDIIGWVLFTIILGVFTSTSLSITPVLAVFLGTIGFAAAALTIGRRFSIKLFDALQVSQFPEPATSLTITVMLGLLFGVLTQKLGIHALFGFFIAGVVVGEAKSLSEQTRGIISQMVHALFVPLFFANIGLKIDFAANFDLPLVLLMCIVGIVGRYLGAWLGVTLTPVPRVNRHLIAIAHTPGGMMEIVVALLALEAGLITQQVFIAIVISAVFSSVTLGPWMASALSRRAAVSPAQFLVPEAVIANLHATTRSAALEQMASALSPQCGAAMQKCIIQTAMAREWEYGTAIGNGVAVPHVRIDGLRNPLLAFGRSPDGIDWDTPDGIPVRYVFLLVTPTATADLHVQILGAIARAMSSAENRRKIAEARNAKELFNVLTDMFAGKNRAR